MCHLPEAELIECTGCKLCQSRYAKAAACGDFHLSSISPAANSGNATTLRTKRPKAFLRANRLTQHGQCPLQLLLLLVILLSRFLLVEILIELSQCFCVTRHGLTRLYGAQAPFAHALRLMLQPGASSQALRLCASTMQSTWVFRTSPSEPLVWLSELSQVC